MTYIELINRFWELDVAYSFSPYEVQLYFILLDYANKSGWKEPLYLPNNRLIARMGCSKTAFIRARQRLNDSGAIRYQKGTTRTAGKYYYMDWSTTDTNQKLIEGQSKTNNGLIERLIAVPYIRQRQELDKDKNIIVDTNVSTKSSTEDIPFKKVVESFNEICKSFSPVKQLTDKRKKHIRARYAKHPLDEILTVFKKMEASSFLKGDNNRGWQASFDWVFKNEDNFVKVLEGKYDDKEVRHETVKRQDKQDRRRDEAELYKSPAGTGFTEEDLAKTLYHSKGDVG
ncbi:hypothetical protein [Mesoaciditoga lauensis]|uniref:hypothetical protein n=1 Tax=Mesoaciditoga lauensis TaxID=1495039 RepID=UPI00068944E6|nr:hypothetical protein [Mesoaciditoga lauensis]